MTIVIHHAKKVIAGYDVEDNDRAVLIKPDVMRE